MVINCECNRQIFGMKTGIGVKFNMTQTTQTC